MISFVKEYIKSHGLFYKTYFYVMSLFIHILKIFVKTDNSLILFVSYGGRHYSDSPKNIFEYMINDSRFSGCNYVWAFVNPDKFEVPNAKKIRIDSFEYYKTALKARIWVTNVVIERALNFTGKNTFYLCTSHGIPLKGKKRDGAAFQPLSSYKYDVVLAQSERDADLQQMEFDIGRERIAVTGYPRNDKFVNDMSSIIMKVRDYFQIPKGKKVILYAPTFRDWNNGYDFLNFNLEKWKNHLDQKYTLLYRTHPSVQMKNSITDDSFFKNASSYEDADELLMAADILISDYSSMFFDFSIMHKPMICWAYDYNEFGKYRFLRVDLINEIYGGVISEEELIEYIAKGNFSKSLQMARTFQEKYVTCYGQATKAAVDLILSKIN